MNTILKEEGFPLALRETYSELLYGSVGSNQWRHLYVRTPDGIVDVIGDGDLACAFFASSILVLCDLMHGGVHTTVTETFFDLVHSGWEEVEEVRPGAVIIWAPKLCSDEKQHRHIGFSIGGDRAISNCPKARTPIQHHFTFDVGDDGEPNRQIEAIFFHHLLD